MGEKLQTFQAHANGAKYWYAQKRGRLHQTSLGVEAAQVHGRRGFEGFWLAVHGSATNKGNETQPILSQAESMPIYGKCRNLEESMREPVGIHVGSMGVYETLWNRGNLRKSMGIPGIYESHGNPRESTGIHGNPRESMEPKGIVKKSMWKSGENYGNPSVTMRNFDSPWKL